MDASRRNEARGAGYDSVLGLPLETIRGGTDMPSAAPHRSIQVSRGDGSLDDNRLAIVIETPALLAQVHAALGDQKAIMDAHAIAPDAAIVIVEAGPDVSERLEVLRRSVRPDAAILVILKSASADAVARAHKAGAFACLRHPLVREELLGLLTAALDSQAARAQAADLSRKLDLESYLASIGRISAGLSHEVSSPLGAAALNMETVQAECRRLLDLLQWLASASADDFVRRQQITRQHLAAFESAEGLAGAITDTVAAHDRLRTLLAMMRELIGRPREIRRASIDIVPLVHEVRKWLNDELRGVDVEIVGDETCALADRTLLGQLLHNLLSNAAHAAKSLSAPRVRIHVYPHSGRVVVSVRDNGPGIPIDLQDKIFEPFFTTRRGQGGTGLGLALCREYARQMGAELSLWSLPGRGACFRISLPKPVPSPPVSGILSNG